MDPAPVEDRLKALEAHAVLTNNAISGLINLFLFVAKELGVEVTFTPADPRRTDN